MQIILIVLLILSTFTGNSQKDTVRLIEPTGPYPVGTITYEWMDSTRHMQYSNHKGDKRTIIVQIWYPASIDSLCLPAPYAALSNDYLKVIGHSYLRPTFSDQVHRSNLILITPGRGTARHLYTTIIEDLVSHGFVVAAVDMPEIGYTIYSDGMIVKPSDKFKTPRGMMAGPYEKVDAFFEKPTQIGLQDLEFVFDRMVELNSFDVNQRFTNKFNLDSIGIFGHSLGGRIAGAYTSKHDQVQAYIAMEGIPPRDVRYQGKIKIPSAMLCSSGTWPYAKENYHSFIDHRKSSVYMIELKGFGHNSVTDNPYIYPEYFNDEFEPQKALNIARRIVIGYFQFRLHGKVSFSNALDELDNIIFSKFE